MILTRKLWRALHGRDRRFPVYNRVYVYGHHVVGALDDNVQYLRMQESPYATQLTAGAVALISLGVTFSGGVLLIPAFFIFLLFAGNFYGARTALATSACIAKEKQQRSYDLLCATPIGTFGVNWAVCQAYLRRYERLRSSENILLRISQTVLVIGVLLMLMITPQVLSVNEPLRTELTVKGLPIVITIMCVAIFLYVDFVYSVVSGSLIGMLAPTYAKNTTDAQLYGPVIFLSFQFATYIGVAVLVYAILPTFWTPLEAQNPYLSLAFPIIQLSIYFFFREMSMWLLWRFLSERLDPLPELLTNVRLFR